MMMHIYVDMVIVDLMCYATYVLDLLCKYKMDGRLTDFNVREFLQSFKIAKAKLYENKL